MEVIIDLMEAYSEHVGLPLLLVNLNGEINYEVDMRNSLLAKYKALDLLLEFKTTSEQLKNPIMMSLPEHYDEDLYYLVTPIFKVKDSKNFLAAGPFQIESTNQRNSGKKRNLPIVFEEEELEDRINKIRNLHLLLANKGQVDTRFSVIEQIQNVLQTMEKFDCNLLDYHQYIHSILDELLKIDDFDFLGYAKRNKEDVFEIQHMSGHLLEELVGTVFYMGEGLLGKAVILGKDFYWSKGIDTQRADFLNKYGVFPKQLFGFIIKEGENVESILFGGSFKNEIISENLLKIVKCVVLLISQRKTIHNQFIDSYYIHSIFSNWLDLMDIAKNVNDRKLLSHKILDFCQTLNNGVFSCFTTVHGEFFYRGNLHHNVIELHNKTLTHKFNRYLEKIWIEQNCIHFYLDSNEERSTLFTIEFNENTDLQQEFYIIGMIEKLLSEAKINKSLSIVQNEISLLNDNSFELLHTSMGEMNPPKYQQSQFAINILKQLVQKLNLSKGNNELLHNICKVLPYQLTYLKKVISQTEEWNIIKGAQDILRHETNDFFTVEMKIIAFLYKVVIHQDHSANLDFLDVELKQLCIDTYKAVNQTSELSKVEMNHQKVDEITDIHSVISTLALTSREKEILYLIIEGLNNQEVGQHLNISIHTVKNHVTNIFKKLNVSDRFQAMAKIYRIKFGDS